MSGTTEDAELQPRVLAPGEMLAEAACPPGLLRGEAILHPGTGVQMTGIEHPADGTWSPAISN